MAITKNPLDRARIGGNSLTAKILLAALFFSAGWIFSTVTGPPSDPSAFLIDMTTTASSAMETATTTTAGTTPLAPAPATGTGSSVQADVTRCLPITDAQTKALQHEIKDYEGSKRFTDKVNEVQGLAKVARHHEAIDKYLKRKVLQPGWSVLELGCAAGMMLKMVDQAYDGGIGAHGDLVGVELVTGWVKFAQTYHKEIKIFEGALSSSLVSSRSIIYRRTGTQSHHAYGTPHTPIYFDWGALPTLIYPACTLAKPLALSCSTTWPNTFKEGTAVFKKNGSHHDGSIVYTKHPRHGPARRISIWKTFYRIITLSWAWPWSIQLITLSDLKRSVATWVSRPAAHCCARREIHVFNQWPKYYPYRLFVGRPPKSLAFIINSSPGGH
jgi:hypothetical protein